MQQAKHSRNQKMSKAPRAIACLAATALTMASHAQNRFWDGNADAAGAGAAPTGTWGVDAFWNTDAGGGAGTFTSTVTATNSVFFSAGTDAISPYTVTVSGTQAAQGLTFQEGATTLTGGVIALAQSTTSTDTNSLINANSTTNGTVQISSGIQVNTTGTGTRLLKVVSGRANALDITGPISVTNAATAYALRLGGAGGGRIGTNLAPAGVVFTGIQQGNSPWSGTWTIAGTQTLGAASIQLLTAASFGAGATLNLGETTADAISLTGSIINTTTQASINISGSVSHGGIVQLTAANVTNITGNYQFTGTPAASSINTGATLNVSGATFAMRALSVGSVAGNDGFVNFSGAGTASFSGQVDFRRGVIDLGGRTVSFTTLNLGTSGTYGGVAQIKGLAGSKIVLGGTAILGTATGSTEVKVETDVDLGTAGLVTSPHGGLLYRELNANASTVSATQEIAGVVSGSVPLANQGNGMLVLSGSNTLTAGFHSRTGTIRFMSDAAMGAVPAVPTEWFRFASTGLQLGASFDIHPNREFSSYQQATTVAPLAFAEFLFDTNGFDSIYTGRITSTVGRDFNGFTKLGAGRLTLTGTSDYAGPTTARGGVLEFATVKNVGAGASSLGAPTVALAGTIFISDDTGGVGARVDSPGTLRYIGSGSTTDRTVMVGGNGAVLEASGAGSLVLASELKAGAWGITLGGTGEGQALGGFSSSVAGIRVLEIVPGSAGTGYTPGLVDVVITDPTGTGATARGVVNPAGNVVAVDLLTAGNGYTNPTVNVVGAGSGAVVRVATQDGYGIGTASPLTKVGSGSWTLGGPVAHSGAVAVNGGTLNFASTVTGLTAVSVADGAVLAMTGSGNTIELDSLAVSATGLFDLNQSDLIVDYTGVSPIAAVLADIAAGRLAADGDFGGLPTYLAVAEAADLGAADLNGIAVDNTAVLVKYTYVGDANLDGQVDALDYERVDLAIGNTGVTGTAQGDLNYDGIVDALDYEQIDLNIGNGVGSPLAGGCAVSTVLVPEPGVLGVVVPGLAALAGRRRRRLA
jgi:autotransporter-associated beta strand protein